MSHDSTAETCSRQVRAGAPVDAAPTETACRRATAPAARSAARAADAGDDCERIDLLFAGSLFAELVFTGAEVPAPGTEVYAQDFAISPGGVANQAYAAARLGRHVAMLSAVGNDPVGELLWRMLDAEPTLDTRWVDRCPRMRTPVTVALSGPTDRAFLTYAPDHHPQVWPVDAPPVGAVNIGIWADQPEWVRRLRAEGTVVVASTGWDHTGQWRHSDFDRLEGVDTFILNDAEARAYLRTDDLHAAARHLGLHVPEVVITCGAGGALVHTASGRCEQVDGVTVDAKDPTGAGDVYLSTFMATFDTGWDLTRRTRLAAICASLSVTRLGGAASAPTVGELTAYLTGSAQLEREMGYALEWLTADGSFPHAPDPGQGDPAGALG